jgi:hypothetical protein
MRLNEILIEKQLDERPMGVLGKLGAKAQTLGPGRAGRRAVGKLEIGKVANDLSDEFDIHMGKADTGQGATPEMVLQFLKKRGYPTKSAEAVMKEPTMAFKAGKAIAKGASAVGKGIVAAKDAAGNVIAGAKAGANAKKEQPKTAPTTTPPPGGGGGAPQKIPSQTDQAKNNPDNNIAIAGGKGKKPPPKKVVNQSVEHANVIAEGFSGAQLDKIFMAAAKDKVAQDEGGVDANKGAAGAVGDDETQGGFFAGFKKGNQQSQTGSTTNRPGVPSDINAQLDKLNVEQKKELLGLL